MRNLKFYLCVAASLSLSACILGPPPPGPPRNEPPPERRGEEPPPPAAVADQMSELPGPGWVHLGMRRVSFTAQQDSFPVTRKMGRFKAMAFIVEQGSLEVFDVGVEFGNGDPFRPEHRNQFDANTRTRVIELPGEARYIRKVDFRYRSTNPDQGEAAIHLFAQEVPGSEGEAAPQEPAAAAPAPEVEPAPERPAAPAEPTPTEPAKSPEGPSVGELAAQLGGEGWDSLGAREVPADGKQDEFEVGSERKDFRAIGIIVEKSDVELFDLEVFFGNDQSFKPKIRQVFKSGSRSRKIGLPGGVRTIKRVTFSYRCINPEKGPATIHLFGQR